jgi:Protein of unknown function (DUF1559)
MRGVVKILIVLFVVLMLGGLLVPAVLRVKEAAKRLECLSNLRQIGIALRNYQDTRGHFPRATVPNPLLTPDKRLSWGTEIWPTYMMGGARSLLEPAKSWDSDSNCPPRWRVRIDGMTGATRDELMGEARVFFCPANPARNDPSLPSPTHDVGLAGLGESAAELPHSDPRAGFFGYDRQLSDQDIKDGLSTTIAVTEVLDGGPWTAGGRATIRGLAAGDRPCLGDGGQFASLHLVSRGLLESRSAALVNALFADASVRMITAAMSPETFEALATIAGGEQVGDLPP